MYEKVLIHFIDDFVSHRLQRSTDFDSFPPNRRTSCLASTDSYTIFITNFTAQQYPGFICDQYSRRNYNAFYRNTARNRYAGPNLYTYLPPDDHA